MPPVLEVSSLFRAVLDELTHKQSELNQADPYNQDHGDHMVEIFQVAVHDAIIRVIRRDEIFEVHQRPLKGCLGLSEIAKYLIRVNRNVDFGSLRKLPKSTFYTS